MKLFARRLSKKSVSATIFVCVTIFICFQIFPLDFPTMATTKMKTMAVEIYPQFQIKFQSNEQDFNENQNPSIFAQSDRDLNEYVNETKYLLDWTTYFSIPMAEGFERSHYLQFCPEFNCRIISNKSMVKEVDAVLFHAINIKWNDVPSERSPDQYYVFWSWEPPSKTPFAVGQGQNFFNLTLTYRLDSDFFSPYGGFSKIPAQNELEKLQRTNKIIQLIRKKTKMVAWFVSSCNAPSKRDMYKNELAKYISVDVYGNCGSLECKSRDSRCFERLYNYKFYLSFENSLCRDYVTEKLFDRVNYFVVPIVLNASLYQKQLPPKSVISATDFATVQELADYLNYLNKNTTAYMEYFEWRNEYVVTGHNWMNGCENPKRCSFCALCAFLHRKHKVIKTKKEVYHWWHTNGWCDSELVPRLIEGE